MKYFIDRATDEVFAYEADGSQDAFIRADLTLLSDDEWMLIQAAREEASKPTQEQTLLNVNSERDGLLAAAGLRIAPLQDAVDEGVATSTEVSMLTRWKQYRIELNRIDQQSGYPEGVVWPETP